VHDEALGHRRRAGSGRAGATLDLDQAQPAGAERLDRVRGAQLRTCVPISAAARMIEVPSGTVTLVPSMVSVTVLAALEAGVP